MKLPSLLAIACLFACTFSFEAASSDGDRPPRILDFPSVKVPKIAGETFANQETVILEAIIKANGKLGTVRVIDSTNRSLNKYAIQALRNATFEPALVNGKAVAARIKIPWHFDTDQKASEESSPDSGAVAFRLNTNYKAILPLKALRLGFGQEGSLKIARVRPEPDGKVTFLTLAPGTYRLAEISTPEQSYMPPPDFAFEINPGQTTYIGDLHLNIKQGAYKWHVRDLHAEDGGAAAIEQIQPAQPDWPIVANVLTARASSYGDIPADRSDSINTDAESDGSGVIALTLAVKKGAPGALGLLSGLVPYKLATFELTYRSQSGVESSFAMNDAVFGKRLTLSDDKEGNLLIVGAKTGIYEIYSVRVGFAGGGYARYTVPFSLPFEVKRGEVVYLGEVYAEPIKKKLAFLQHDAFARFQITNQWDRDKLILAERRSDLVDVGGRVSLLQASGDWREIFISEADSSAVSEANPREIEQKEKD